MSRTTSASSTTTTATTTSGHVRTVSVKANNAKPQQLNPMPASDIRLFVTNLRLLDFDLRDDWPDITVQTFSAKNADQRQRIAGIEWALFRLFEIWDPSETAQKLQPFFPPLEPLQSLNLRAALFRCLNELKKNGVLGRESVLRKTMLDECKGDKFYEILAIFSNVTLKKVLAARDGGGRDEAVARRLATAPMLPIDQQQSLLPLAIAHRAALVNVLKKKEEKRRKYMEFEAMLDKKAEDINRRIQKCKDSPRAQKPVVSQKEADAVKRQLKDNWIGNQKWLNVMLHGEETHTGDAFLNTRFDKVWYMVEKGRKLEDVAPETGLLENLQSRVQEQQERLQKWKDFHEELQNDASGKENRVNLKRVAPIKELKFDAHSQYQLPPSKQTVEQTAIKRPAMRVEYRDILSDMDVELQHAGKIRAGPVSTILPRRRASPAKEVQSPIPKRKPTLPEPVPASPTSPVVPPKPKHLARPNSLQKVPILPKPSHHVAAASTPIDSEATLVGQASALRSSPPAARHAGSPIRKSPPPTPPPTVTLTVQQASPSPNERASNVLSDYPSEPPVPTFEPPILDPDEAMADQIINSIGNATPSPVKKPQPRMSLSLLERTRLTMSRTNSSENALESPLRLPSMAPPPLPANHVNPAAADLLERTRLSMVASQSVPRPKPSKPQRKSSGGRQSLYPVNQFDTPPRNRQSSAEMLRQGSVEPVDAGEESPGLERTPTEQLFSDEVDYDRVFKSRPLIATSPVWSPGGGEDDDDPDGVTGIDLRDVDQDDDEEGEEGGYGGSWMDSPSHKRRVRC
ncbi:HAUS augmin-like complex subunit 6 N-terminus-domain-containing protein [Bipolaris maydis]|nr:HAUS augmin-like complex subunit 6 N-terminus-domain-containing protein [Bipolaris maydis]